MGRKAQYHIDEKQLRDLVAEKITMPEIAKRLNVPIKVVRTNLKKHGIVWERKGTRGQRRIDLPKEYLEREYVEKGRSATDIANEKNTTHKTVTDRLREYGIRVRETTEYERDHHDWTGRRVGLLVPSRVVEERKVYSDKPHVVWLCQCDCGKTTEVPSISLANKNTRSCGCLKEAYERRKWVGDLSSTYWKKVLRNARLREIKVEITAMEAWTQFQRQRGICPLTGVTLKLGWTGRTASLDRIDSSRHYTADNIQWVWKPVNRAKGTMSTAEFVEMCRMVADYAPR